MSFQGRQTYLSRPQSSSDDIFTLDIDEGKVLVTNLHLPAEQQRLGQHLLRNLLSQLQQLPADPWRVSLPQVRLSLSLFVILVIHFSMALCLLPFVHKGPRQAPGLTASHLKPQTEGVFFIGRGALRLQEKTIRCAVLFSGSSSSNNNSSRCVTQNTGCPFCSGVCLSLNCKNYKDQTLKKITRRSYHCKSLKWLLIDEMLKYNVSKKQKKKKRKEFRRPVAGVSLSWVLINKRLDQFPPNMGGKRGVPPSATPVRMPQMSKSQIVLLNLKAFYSQKT